ncbi:DUF4829 domain-containing protein [Clostridium sp. YB-6]|uniref:DUF4829 domain-containing protein n=2 Tax=Clostridium weizhouense TaxID=2859781 RepID=A0ABS7AQV4_9CLOT|nr:DUF4829 domain-containing protein [Clostridium weizhouense]
MRDYKIAKSITLILLVFIIMIFVVSCSEQNVGNNKNEIANEEISIVPVNPIILTQAIKLPEDVIRDAFEYENAHQLKSLLECYTIRHKDTNFRLDNLESCKLESLSLIKDESIYNSYFKSGLGLINGVKRENVRIYTVKYNVQYKDQSKEPEDSGERKKMFTLIRENNLGEWKIEEIGEF